ncbi:MAG: copper chaperone Copz family protein [Anaerolineales bacterium]
MTDPDFCGCPPEAGNLVCELPAQAFQRPTRAAHSCPECQQTAKPVPGQTVKSLLSVSLREVRKVDYFFCRTQTCPVVYFSSDGEQSWEVGQVRERVYQKEPEASDVLVCYCFQHSAGAVRMASPESRMAILENINTGIAAGQCACDLRNPQGSCCLGNVRALIKQLERRVIRMS